MSTQITALLMFLLLTYLLFRRPASAAPRRGPAELHIQVRHPVYIKNEAPKEKAMSVAGGSCLDKSSPRKIEPGIASILPAGAQAQLSVDGNDSKADKEDKKERQTATLGLVWWFGKEGRW